MNGGASASRGGTTWGRERRFSLFNTSRWKELPEGLPANVGVVPVMYQGLLSFDAIERCIYELRTGGSKAVPGFMTPEGICVFHLASGQYYKYTLDGDGHKGVLEAAA